MAKIKKKHIGYLIPALLLILGALFLYLKSENAAGGIGSGGYKTYGYFQGGKPANDLNIQSVRWHKHNGYERLVLDVVKWNGVFSDAPYTKAQETGRYEVGRELNSALSIDGELSGYRAFSAKMPSFSKSALIKKMEVLSNDDGTFIFTIYLKHAGAYKVFTLKHPARIVIDIK